MIHHHVTQGKGQNPVNVVNTVKGMKKKMKKKYNNTKCMCVDPHIHDGDCKASEVINSILTVINRYVSIVWSLAAILVLENLKKNTNPTT
jgi:hypothetical protein